MHPKSGEHSNRVIIHHHGKVDHQFAARHGQMFPHIVIKAHDGGHAVQLLLGHRVSAGALNGMRQPRL